MVLNSIEKAVILPPVSEVIAKSLRYVAHVS